jgi:hypothetical protein
MGILAPPELPWRRVVGAAAVLVLHIAIVAVLLRATIVQRILAPSARETILMLPALPKPVTRRAQPPARSIVPTYRLKDYRAPILPQLNDENSKAPQGLGFQLFDCRIENLSKLTEEQRALCARSSTGPTPDDSVDFADHTNRARDAARWARQLKRKNQPVLLPCASSQSIFSTLSTDTILCLAHGVIHGFDLDAGPIYGERPEEQHVPNGGDAPPAYTDPDH